MTVPLRAGAPAAVTPGHPPAVPPVPAGPRAGIVVLLAALAAVGALSIDMYLPALPAIARGLAAEPSVVQWSLSVFFAGFSLGQLVWGPLSDRVGRRAPMLAGLLLYVLGALLCAAATTAPLLVAARFVQALGGSAGAVLSRAVVSDLTDREGAARLMSTLMVVMGVAPLAAPAVGAEVLAVGGWRAIFLLLAVVGATLAVVTRRLPETLPPERRRRGPLADVWRGYAGLLRRADFVAPVVAAAAASSGMFAYITASPFLFIEGYGLSPRAYTAVFASNVVGYVGAAALNSRLVPRLGSRRMLALGVALSLAASATLLVVAAAGGGVRALLPALWLSIASISLVSPNAIAAALAVARQVGGTGAALAGCLQFGIAAVVGAVVAAFDNRSPVPMAAAIVGTAVVTLAATRVARRVE